MDNENTVSIKRAAELLNVNRKHVYKLIDRGLLRRVRRPVYAEHGPVGIPLVDIQALLDKPRPE